MNKYAETWLNIASEDLASSKILYTNENYSQAIYLLQQCNEKLSKAILIQMGFIRTENESEKQRILRSILKVNLSEQDFGHRWHKKLITLLEDILKVSMSFESISELVPKKPNEPLFFTNNFPDFKQRIDAAKKVNTNPDPSFDELAKTIEFCHLRLRESVDNERAFMKIISELKLPNVDPIIADVESLFGIRLKKSRKDKLKKALQDPGSALKNSILYSQIVTILAILSIYLVDHEEYARYPSTKFKKKYDRSLAVVGLFNDLIALHDEIIVLMKNCSITNAPT